jgi:hypothetical protein
MIELQSVTANPFGAFGRAFALLCNVRSAHTPIGVRPNGAPLFGVVIVDRVIGKIGDRRII